MKNLVILIGNIGQDPEIQGLRGGRKIAKFSLATSKNYNDKSGERQTQTEWHNVVFFGQSADYIEKYAKKGSQVYVEGEIQYREYEDKDGQNRKSTQILGNEFSFVGGKG